MRSSSIPTRSHDGSDVRTSSGRRYAGFSVTRMAPMLAHAHCSMAYALCGGREACAGVMSLRGAGTATVTMAAPTAHAPIVAHDDPNTIPLPHTQPNQAPCEGSRVLVQLAEAPCEMCVDPEVVRARSAVMARWFAPTYESRLVGVPRQDVLVEVRW